MAEPPSGVMDSSCDLGKDEYNIIYDIADEEVHFSRDLFTKGFHLQHQNNNQQPIAQLTINQQNAIPLNFTDINLNYQQQSTCDNEDNSEQIRSSKLLNSIGSRIRRSSNYLAVPRLVGQYLLGITIQSWSEFLNTSRMMKAPSNTHQLTRRVLTNLTHFQGNYLCVSLVLVIYCILTSPLLLLALIAYVLALYLVTARSATGRHMRIFGFRPNLQQQYSFITFISLPLLWVAGAPSAVFWVIGASFVVVGLHASMYNTIERPLPEINDNNNHLSKYNSRTSVQYYNHYPTSSQYLSLPNSAAHQSGSNNYASTISQWMMFGGSKQNKSQKLDSPSTIQSIPKSRTPDVTIISQDYAGLGRVYEI